MTRDEGGGGGGVGGGGVGRPELEALCAGLTSSAAPPPEDRPSSPPVVIVDDEPPPTDRIPEGEIRALVAETGDQLARELLAEGYRRR
jgi:hypothetical protein